MGEARRRPSPPWAVLLIAALLFGLPFSLFLDRTWHGRNDFVGLYLGAHLAGQPTLYDRDANHTAVRELLGHDLEGVVFVRLPHYGQMLRPLRALGAYVWSYRAWIAINLAALLAFALLARKWSPDAPALTALSLPASLAIVNGQDPPLLLLALTAAVIAHGSGRPVLAGALLSLLSAKFHLMILAPAALLFRRDWRVLAGGVAGGIAQLAIAFAAQGPDWMSGYLRVMLDPEITPCKSCMPNLYGAAIALQGEGLTPALAVLGLAAAAAVLPMLAARPAFDRAIAWSVTGGLLLNHHAAIHDFTLLLFPLVTLMPELESRAARTLFAIAGSPLPYAVSLAGSPYNVAVPGLLLAAAAAEAVTRLHPALRAPAPACSDAGIGH